MLRAILLLENILFIPVGLLWLLRFALSPRASLLRNLGSELAERLGRTAPGTFSDLGPSPPLWIHAASAGEVLAVSPLLKGLKSRFPGQALVLSVNTAAGREAGRRAGVADRVVLAPVDFYPAVMAFIRRLRPCALILVEAELWPQMIQAAVSGGLPVYLVNARLSPRGPWTLSLLRWVLGPSLGCLTRIVAQTEEDAARFRRLGAPASALTVAGNMKHDQEMAIPNPAVSERLGRLAWTGDPLFVAGSTHPREEEMLVEAFQRARARFKHLRLAMAPRHVERAGQAEVMLRSRGLRVARWSQERPGESGAEVLLIDAMGLLSGFYALASISFVGGTLVPVGGHNLLEPAVAGSPVIFGPHVSHQVHAADQLLKAGGAFVAADAAELAGRLERLLSDPAAAAEHGRRARATAERMRGATARTLEALEYLLIRK
ncbi:MAG: 3-deoxy-D-manno-octulosonic acid transferase [Elusimicrobia bacterium]|nr:3-deoxy-D-manno-octulosonic acid transferase [Elusimicrobiota bacterium]